MDKIDLKKQYKSFYAPSNKEFSFIRLPALNYLSIDGHGAPDSALYMDAIQTLYSLAYTLKFTLKKSGGSNYTVMGLEGLWWMDDMTQFSADNKNEWLWTAMILQPEFITSEMLDEAIRTAQAKGKAPLGSQAHLQTLAEGECVQIMFIGAYDAEAPTIVKMHAFIREQGYIPHGKHHEIYLSDPRRVAPEKNRTILRQPVRQN